MAEKFPIADSPGVNTTLSPEKAPHWLRSALDVTGEDVVEIIGKRAQQDVLPSPKSAAVLMLLGGTSADDATVLLTHRSPHLRSHSGQIAFPGGKIDSTDVNLIDAALREAWEETGLDRTSITPLAHWGETFVPVRGNRINAVLAHWHTPGTVGVVNPEEADDVFVLPVEELLAPENRMMLAWDHWTTPAFRVNGYVIWGFTAAALTILFLKTGWEQEWDQTPRLDLRAVIAASRNNERRV